MTNSVRKKSLVFDQPTACSNFGTGTYLSVKSSKIRENPSTRSCFRLSRLCWILWWSQIWWLQGVQRSIFCFGSYHWSSSMNSSVMSKVVIDSRLRSQINIIYAYLNQAFNSWPGQLDPSQQSNLVNVFVWTNVKIKTGLIFIIVQ